MVPTEASGLAALPGGATQRRPCYGSRKTSNRIVLMQRITLDVESGLVSAELAQRGIPPKGRVHVLVEVPESADLPMAALAQSGGAFDFLADEPDLYTEADVVERFR